MAEEPTPEPARTEELADAFRLVFRHLAPKEQDRRVANSLHLVQRGELDRDGIFVLRGPAGLLGALICLPVPGASALVWPPGVVEDGRRVADEDSLVRAACAWLRGRGVKLGQALLSPAEVRLATPLQRNGFPHVTTLWFMRHGLDLPAHSLAAPARLIFQPYDPGHPERFHRTLLDTYEGTQDCPEISGVRTVEEVIRGHQAQGIYDPDLWWMALQGDEPVGVLITSALPDSGEWEVAYMGVVPRARRRGFGREILLKALTEVRAAGVHCVTLSVDGRNRPAWDLYAGLGFEAYDRREVFLAVWRPGG